MWQRPHPSPHHHHQQQQQCLDSGGGGGTPTTDHAHHHCAHHHIGASTAGRRLSVNARRCTAPPTSHAHAQPQLHFPPPPTSKMADEAVAGPSSRPDPPWPPADYSYAYYEPGPPIRHTDVPSKYPGAYREGSYRARHTYLTRYGTEENIYEEISELARARRLQQQQHAHHAHAHQASIMSLSQSLVEEEVRRVQSGHRRVLGELNLSVEAMLMPSSGEGDGGGDDDDSDVENDDQLADLLTVGPTDDLLSPVALGGADLDSGFSGSSSGASYRSAGGSLRKGASRCSTPAEGGAAAATAGAASGRGFWGRKAWRKIAAFPSNISLNKTKGG